MTGTVFRVFGTSVKVAGQPTPKGEWHLNSWRPTAPLFFKWNDPNLHWRNNLVYRNVFFLNILCVFCRGSSNMWQKHRLAMYQRSVTMFDLQTWFIYGHGYCHHLLIFWYMLYCGRINCWSKRADHKQISLKYMNYVSYVGKRFRYTHYERSCGEIYQSIENLDRMVSNCFCFLLLWLPSKAS